LRGEPPSRRRQCSKERPRSHVVGENAAGHTALGGSLHRLRDAAAGLIGPEDEEEQVDVMLGGVDVLDEPFDRLLCPGEQLDIDADRERQAPERAAQADQVPLPVGDEGLRLLRFHRRGGRRPPDSFVPLPQPAPAQPRSAQDQIPGQPEPGDEEDDAQPCQRGRRPPLSHHHGRHHDADDPLAREIEPAERRGHAQPPRRSAAADRTSLPGAIAAAAG